MTDDIRDDMLKILTQVNELRDKEAQLVQEKEGHMAQQKKSEDEFARCTNEIRELKEREQQLKIDLAEINNQLFYREDEPHPEAPPSPQSEPESMAKRLWTEQAKLIKKQQQS